MPNSRKKTLRSSPCLNPASLPYSHAAATGCVGDQHEQRSRHSQSEELDQISPYKGERRVVTERHGIRDAAAEQ
jgi:hypothetical protein